MKKLFFLLTLLFVLPLTSIVYGAAEQPTHAYQNWHCLNSVICTSENAGCATGTGVVAGHRAKLSTKATDLPSPNVPVYVMVCFATVEGSVCTTGNGAVDLKVLGYDGEAKLITLVDYEYQGVFQSGSAVTQQVNLNLQPTTTDNVGVAPFIPIDLKNDLGSFRTNDRGKITLNGKIIEPLEMQDYTPKAEMRKWVTLDFGTPLDIPVGKGGVQQGTFTFDGALSKCTAIGWDPYGIVFDSQSLEPVSGIKISLTRKRVNGLYTLVNGDDIPGILNPIITSEDGSFTFIVPDGTYKINPTASNFIFPSIITLPKTYLSVYSDIYKGEDIIQKGAIQHRDVPIDSKTVPYTSPIKLMSYFPLLDKASNILIVQGKVSHPLTTINVYGKKASTGVTSPRTKLLVTTKANKLGQYEIKVDLTKLDPGEVVGDIELIKPNYLTLADATDVKGATAVFTIDPILNHVEGYAYDSTGKVLSGTTVQLFLKGAITPYYEAKADDKGFFKISSEYISPLASTIKYKTITGVLYSVPITTFIAQNEKYLLEIKDNPYSFKDKSDKVFPVVKEDVKVNVNNSSSTQAVAADQSNMILFVVIILLLVSVIGAVLAIYLMKKHQQESPPIM
ncbi:MAG: hypothetical protein Q7R95_08860 [bacterium]|nr:hypothetical protein [bacterium]